MQTRLTKEGRAVVVGLLKLGAWTISLTICAMVLSSVFGGGSEPPARPSPQPSLPPSAMGLTSPVRSFPAPSLPPTVDQPLVPRQSIYMYGVGQSQPRPETPPPPPSYFSYDVPLVHRHVEVHQYNWHPPKSAYEEYVQARERNSTYREQSPVHKEKPEVVRAKHKMGRAEQPEAHKAVPPKTKDTARPSSERK